METMKIFDFPPMLGPCEDYPEGSPAWALRIGARLRYEVENIESNGANSVIKSVRKIMTVAPPPWTIWPEGNPCRTVDGYFELICGHTWDRIIALIGKVHQDHDLERLLQTAKAATDSARVKQGTRTDLDELAPNGCKLPRGHGNAQATLLRRLAREHAEILAAWRRGEYKSVRAAAIAAGIVTPPTPLDKAKSVWKKMSDGERAAFLEWVPVHGGKK